MFKKILIANRGEIACRVIKTARKMGIATVAVYSEADTRALHVEMADEKVAIGPPAAAQSYLMIEKIVAACKQTGAEAVHPGYGFLSERSAFPKALSKAGIIFIGPNAAADARAEFAPFKNITGNSLASQLKMVARLIGARSSLGAKRQVFFVSLGGFDLHDNLITGHTTNMKRVSDAMTAFHQTTVNLGVDSSVTAFTASDFGRTYNTNGDGSDHGWGSHHFMLGGAVKGGDIYGKMPNFAMNGPDDTGRGRWIPSTSVDEFAATLAKWFGVSATNLPVIFPNIGRFAKPDLGFMNA